MTLILLSFSTAVGQSDRNDNYVRTITTYREKDTKGLISTGLAEADRSVETFL